ncbi:interleukin-18-like isoform X2 [Vombatus ursinus]|uniref:Interleukin-18 n=1 Tax=Vombatus ursinus TaxID=29139 RepID=A0A4X2LWN4_VOMUR|nr:interleukin-18-like isoform X2 [Vombatus ursinus]
MATSADHPVAACAAEMNFDLNLNSIDIVDLDLRDNTLYLIVKQEFNKLGNHCAILRNMKGRVLVIVKGGKMAVFEEMSDSEITANAPRTQFIIQHYKETLPKGLAVAISVKTEKKTYTLSCKDKKLHFKESAAPDKIDGKEQDVLFYQERIPGHDDKMQFKSFLYPEYYLACKQEKKSIFKLILKKGCQDEEGSTKFVVRYECKKIGS